MAASDSDILAPLVQSPSDELAPLVQPPQDELAPLVQPPSDDLAPLKRRPYTPTQYGDRWFALDPQSASLNVQQSLLLQVKCFDAAGKIEKDCDVDDPQATAQVDLHDTRWRVNGVEGGNDVVGRISREGLSATYRAPATVPNPATVALSATLQDSSAGKDMLIANITIVDHSYYAKVRFNGKREEQGATVEYAGTADLHFYLADSFQGGTRYDLIPGSSNTKVVFEKWSVRDDARTCQLVSNATAANLDAPYTGTLFLYSALQSYVFQALFEAQGAVKCRDGDTIFEDEVWPRVLLTTSKGPPDPGLQPLGDGKKLAGNATMNMRISDDEEDKDRITQTIHWTISKPRH